MKKVVLKLVMCAFVLTAGLNVIAQPPTPPSNMGADNSSSGGQDLTQGKTSINRQQAPVGTATLLMLGLGGAFLGYKLRNNNKEEEK